MKAITKNEVRDMDKTAIAALTQEEVSALAKTAYACYETACTRFKLTALPHVAPVAPVAETTVTAPAPKPIEKQHKQPEQRKQEVYRGRGPLVEGREVFNLLPHSMQSAIKAVEAETAEIGYSLRLGAHHDGKPVTLTATSVYLRDASNPKSWTFALMGRSARNTWKPLMNGDSQIRDRNNIKVIIPSDCCHSAVEGFMNSKAIEAELKSNGFSSKKAHEEARRMVGRGERRYTPVAYLVQNSRSKRAELHVKHTPGELQVQLRKVG